MTTTATLVIYLAIVFVGWIALTLLRVVVNRPVSMNNPTMPHRAVAVILFVALVARVMVVFTTEPVLSDDIWRYIDDGRQLSHGLNPYAHSPQDRLENNADTDRRITERVNHPELVTIYQPVSQWVFAATYRIARAMHLTHDADAWAQRDGTRAYRLVFVLFDLWLIALLVLKLLRDKRSPWFAALYAWHPLVIAEVAWSGHQDVIGIAWLLMALLLADPRGLFDTAHEQATMPGDSPHRRHVIMRAILAGGALALAVGVKPIVAPIALPLCWHQRRKPIAVFAGAIACIMTLAALYVPFMLMPAGLDGMTQTIEAFINHWSFNSPVHVHVQALLGSRRATDLAAICIAVGVMFVTMIRHDDPYRAVMLYLFFALLLSSTIYPWYLLWALAFVPLRFNSALWVWSLTIALSYEVLTHTQSWELPQWVMIAQFTPVAIALLLTAVLRSARRATEA